MIYIAIISSLLGGVYHTEFKHAKNWADCTSIVRNAEAHDPKHVVGRCVAVPR